jgi:protein-tyrosine phosphatase
MTAEPAVRIEAILARLLSSPTYRAELEGDGAHTHAPVPGTMERVLELIDERFAGSAAWPHWRRNEPGSR